MPKCSHSLISLFTNMQCDMFCDRCVTVVKKRGSESEASATDQLFVISKFKKVSLLQCVDFFKIVNILSRGLDDNRLLRCTYEVLTKYRVLTKITDYLDVLDDNRLLCVYEYSFQKILHLQRTVIFLSTNLSLSIKCMLTCSTKKKIIQKPHSSRAVLHNP